MIPNLPRPLLWTEIKNREKFLHGDSLIEKFYKILNGKGVPSIDEVTFLNELYYQLTRYYYEKPERKDCLRYYEDILSNLGEVELADLVMTMMYHYCRLKSNRIEFSMSTFMAEVRIEQESNSYWQKFSCIQSHARRWQKDILSPDNPCPVPPIKLDGKKIDWKTITQNYDYMFVQEVVGLWHGENDKKDVASILMMYLNSDNPQIPFTSGLHQTKQFLIKVMNGQGEKVTSLKFDSNNPSDNEKFLEAAKFISEYNMKKELEEKNKEVLQLKKENKKLEEKLIKAEKLNEKRLAEAEQWHRSYDRSESEAATWRSKYEIADAKLKSDGMILETARRYSDKPLSPDIILRRFSDNEEYKKKEKALEDKIKNLQEKLGNESVPLSVLAEGLMEYAEEAGLAEAHLLFNQLNNLLITVSAWTKNVPELKKFFKNARKEMEEKKIGPTNIGQQNVFPNVGTYNNTVKEQNNNFSALPLGQQGEKQLE